MNELAYSGICSAETSQKLIMSSSQHTLITGCSYFIASMTISLWILQNWRDNDDINLWSSTYKQFELVLESRGGSMHKNVEVHCFDVESLGQDETKLLDKLVNQFKVGNHPLVGLDCEWEPESLKEKISSSRVRKSAAIKKICSRISTIQLANDDICVVLRFNQPKIISNAVLPLPASVAALVGNSSVIKAGVEIREDARRLHRDFGVRCSSIVDLRRIVRTIKEQAGAQHFRAPLRDIGTELNSTILSTTDFCLDWAKSSSDLHMDVSAMNLSMGLRALAKTCLGLTIDKDPNIRCSDWSQPLTMAQLEYAATDAWVSQRLGTLLFHLALRGCIDYQELQSTPTISGEERRQRATEWLTRYFRSFETPLDFEEWERVNAGADQQAIHSQPREEPCEGEGGLPIRLTGNRPPVKAVKGLKKSPRGQIYDNCKILAPDGELLCTASRRKVQWYLDKQLGELVTTPTADASVRDEALTLRLFFEPSGRANADDQCYISSNKENVCCVCGKGTEYLRHSIVPSQYRHWFPESMKAHISHDVVLLCRDCQSRCSNFDDEFSAELATRYAAPMGGNGGRFVKVPENVKVRGRCLVMLRHMQQRNRAVDTASSPRMNEAVAYTGGDQIESYSDNAANDKTCSDAKDGQRTPCVRGARAVLPQRVFDEYVAYLKNHFGVDEITKEVLERGSNLEVAQEVEGWKSHGKLVVDAVKREGRGGGGGGHNLTGVGIEQGEGGSSGAPALVVGGKGAAERDSGGLEEGEIRALGAFVRTWRRRFVDRMQPRFLPAYWRVDNRVINSYYFV